jgi:hypothetical protein
MALRSKLSSTLPTAVRSALIVVAGTASQASSILAQGVNRLGDDVRHGDIRAIEPHAAGLDAGHVEHVRNDGEQRLAAFADMRAIVEIARVSEVAEGLLLHHLREADDVVERRPQLVAHIGQELGFGAVGALRMGFLFEVAFGEFGELRCLQFESLARAPQVGDGRHQPPLGIEQLFLMAFQRGNVGADRNIAAIFGASFVDLQPSPVAEPRFVGPRAGLRALADGNLRLHLRRRAHRHQLPIGGAGDDSFLRQIVQALEFRIAHHEAVVGIPQHEGLRNRLDGIAQAHVGGFGLLGEQLLVGDVDGDADEMRAFVRSMLHELGARPQPDIFATAVADAEGVVNAIGLGGCQHFRHGREVAVLRMDEGVHVAAG